MRVEFRGTAPVILRNCVLSNPPASSASDQKAAIYAGAMVQRIMRRLLIGPHLSIGKMLTHSFVRVEVCEVDYGIACVNNHNDL